MSQKYIFVTILGASLAVACGDDDTTGTVPGGDAEAPDAGPDSPDGDTETPDADPTADDTATVVALGASEGVGITSTIGIRSLYVRQDVAQGVADGDPTVRHVGDEIYVLNQSQDNVTILDEDLELVNQFSLDGYRNPHDVVVHGDSIYVSAYDSEGVVVLDRTDPSADAELIDLSEIDGEDNIPDCSAMHLVGDTLLVACQRLERDPDDENVCCEPRGPGVIAMIDTDDNSFETLEMDAENPFSRFVATPDDGPLGGDLLISSVEGFDGTGCVERVSLEPEPTSECFLDHGDAGGWVGSLAVDGSTVWLVTAGLDGNAVVPYDTAAEDYGEPLTPDDQSPTELAICPDGEIVVADKPFEEAQGIRLYADGEEITEAPLDIGAEPVFANGLACFEAIGG